MDLCPDQGALSLSLCPTLDDDSGLAGFLLQLSGETELDFSTPMDLRRAGIGEKFSVRLVGKRFTVQRCALATQWKDVRKLAEAGLLEFLTEQIEPEDGVQSVIPASDTKAALTIRPLATRLAIVKDHQEKPHLAMLMAVGSAASLNAGMQVPDRDDIHSVGRVRTQLLSGALVSIEHVHPDWESPLNTFFSTLINTVAPYEDEWRDSLDPYEVQQAFRKLRPQFEALCRAPPADQLDDTMSPPSSPEPEQSTDEEVVEAPSPPRGSKGNKHSHILPSFWFVTPSALTFRKYASASICKATATAYSSHIRTWLTRCHSKSINPIDPALHDLITYLSDLASSKPSASVTTCIMALKKFFAINLVNFDLFNHPSVLAFTQGLKNLPTFSAAKRKIRLTMTPAALKIVGHTVQSFKNWSDRDVLMTWTFYLVSFYGSCRAGDILSTRVNSATDKVLLWADVTFDLPGGRVVIFLRSPKSSVGNKGHSIVLSKNPEAKMCPVRHLWDLKQVSPDTGPVFTYDSGKFLTPQSANSILRRASTSSGVPENSQFSCHSLRAGIPTMMALDPGKFTQTEIRAAGRWKSDAASKYVRCQLKSADNLSRKVYELDQASTSHSQHPH